MNRKTSRLRGLDALRGVAALGVVLFHYTTGYEKIFGKFATAPLFHFASGCFGVQLFFCISGFVILRTLERTPDAKSFAIARFARLYPAYLACAAITLLTIAAADLHLEEFSAKAIALNATMLALLAGVPRIDPSYWTLTYEVLFYAAVALLWFRLRPRRRLEVPCLIWLACSLTGHIDPIHRHHRLCTLLNIDFANFFVIGMMLHYLSKRARNRLTIPTLSAAVLMSLFAPGANGVDALFRAKFTLLIGAFSAAIWFAADAKTAYLDFAPFVFLGEISYSLYLIHQIVGFAVIRTLLAAGLQTNATLLITISFMIGLAFCLRTFVEKPAERWIKHRAKRADSGTNPASLARAASGS